MHYKNGRLAKAGDLVRGRGFNVPREVEAIVLGVTPERGTCNLRVAYLGKDLVDLGNLIGRRNVETEALVEACVRQEYGDAANFLAIDPQTGAVLEPDPTPEVQQGMPAVEGGQ